MNSKTKQFVEYLLYIGFTTNETINKLLEIVEKKVKGEKEGEINQNEFLKSMTVEYIKSFDEKGLEKLGENIYEQYKKNKLITITKYLSRIITINETQKLRKVNKYFDIWHNITIEEFISNKPRMGLRQSKSEKNFMINKDPEMVNNFLNKLDDYQCRIENSKKKIIKEKEEENMINCTFTPNLNLTKTRYCNVRPRVNLTGHFIPKDNPVSYPEEKPQKKYNKNKIDKLYNDYQKRCVDKEILEKNIYKEKGYTFTPKLNINNKYTKNIKDNFLERNKKMLEEKKEFIASFNYLRNMEIKGNELSSLYEPILKKK